MDICYWHLWHGRMWLWRSVGRARRNLDLEDCCIWLCWNGIRGGGGEEEKPVTFLFSSLSRVCLGIGYLNGKIMLRGRHATPHHATIVRGSWKRRRMQKHDTAQHGMASKPSRRRRTINGLYAHCRTHCCVQYQRCLGLVVKRRISSLAPSSPPSSPLRCSLWRSPSPLPIALLQSTYLCTTTI